MDMYCVLCTHTQLYTWGRKSDKKVFCMRLFTSFKSKVAISNDSLTIMAELMFQAF